MQTFGRFSSIATSGLNYHIPWPIQQVTIVDVESVRRVEIGFRTSAGNSKQEVLSEAFMLTMAENIVRVELLFPPPGSIRRHSQPKGYDVTSQKVGAFVGQT